MDEPKKVFIVVRGIPAQFGDLSHAEEYAAEQCERTHEPYTIAVMDREMLDHALVARYLGVRLMTIKEAKESSYDDES